MKVMLAALVWTVLVSQVAFGEEVKKMPHVTGIGGVFFKAKGDHKALAEWYQQHLGVKLQYGMSVFKWPADTAEDKGSTAWKIDASDSNWFEPSESGFMINYRVDDLLGMVANLQKDGIEILKGPEFHENGKFAWLLDPEGNKIELWEPKIWDAKNKEH